MAEDRPLADMEGIPGNLLKAGNCCTVENAFLDTRQRNRSYDGENMENALE